MSEPLSGTIEVKPTTADHIKQLTSWLAEHGEDANHVARFITFNEDGTITFLRYKMRENEEGKMVRYIVVRAGEDGPTAEPAYDEVIVTPKRPFPVYPVHSDV